MSTTAPATAGRPGGGAGRDAGAAPSRLRLAWWLLALVRPVLPPLLLSFHAIPVAMHEAGDPYRAECEATTAAVAAILGLPGGVAATYQSVFGPAEWLTPATIDTVAELGARGVRRVDVVCPGFVSDCLETLEEIDMLNRAAFCDAGGEEFHYVSWGDDRPAWTSALAALVDRHLAGWRTAGLGGSAAT